MFRNTGNRTIICSGRLVAPLSLVRLAVPFVHAMICHGSCSFHDTVRDLCCNTLQDCASILRRPTYTGEAPQRFQPELDVAPRHSNLGESRPSDSDAELWHGLAVPHATLRTSFTGQRRRKEPSHRRERKAEATRTLCRWVDIAVKCLDTLTSFCLAN